MVRAVPKARTTYVVTGFPSWIAKSVVREIAQEEEGARVHLLVAPDRSAAAEAFLRGVRSLDSVVEILEGDAVRMDLGLAGRAFVALAHDVEVIVNLYDVSPLADAPDRDRSIGYGGLYGRLGDPADLTVKAAREAVELATAAPRLRHLIHLSSLTVTGDYEGVWTDEDVSIGQRHRTAAGRARHRAERLLWRRRDALPFTSVRVGAVLGDSRSGAVEWYHGPHDLIDLLLVSGRPHSRTRVLGRSPVLHLVPSDHLARVVRALASSAPERSGAVNLASPEPVSWLALQAAVWASVGAVDPRLVSPEATRRLRERMRRRYGPTPAAVARTIAKIETRATCSIRRAVEIERAAGLRFPRIAECLPNLVVFALGRAAAEAERFDEVGVEDALDH